LPGHIKLLKSIIVATDQRLFTRININIAILIASLSITCHS